MARYPKSIRDAVVKCVLCNAPGAKSLDGAYVCVECGETIVEDSGKAMSD